MFRRLLPLILIFSSMLISCGRVTSEFNFIDEKDENYRYYAYKMTAASGDYTISFYSGTKSSYGGYGSYGQLIRDYSSGDLASIVKDDDSCFSIRSNSSDARGTSSNIINFEISFPERKVSSIDIKASFSALENDFVNSGALYSPLALSDLKLYVTLADGSEKTTTLHSSNSSSSSFSKLNLDKTIDISTLTTGNITAVKLTAVISKYYSTYSSTSKYADLNYKKTDSNLSLYKIILN